LIRVSIIGSPAEKLNIDCAEDGNGVAAVCAAVEDAKLVAVTVASIALPLKVLRAAVRCGFSPPGQRPSASQKRARHIALIDHGSHPSQTKTTRPNRSHVVRVRIV
jgi:hypothetical protein